MPETIAAVTLAAKAAFTTAASYISTATGLSYATSAAILSTGLQLGASLALSAALAPDMPTPEASQFNVKQARPARRFGVGTTRVSGALAFKEAEKNRLHQVIAWPEGPIVSFGRTWLNDDEVTLIGDAVQQLASGRYETGRARIQDRYGSATETNYGALTATFPTEWPSNARGDGVPSSYLKLENGKLADAQKQFPAGAGTELTREASYAAYDWRDEAQDRDDPGTWTVTGNPVVWLVNLLWRRYGADWDRRFAPVLDVLSVEANICDEAVPLRAGGTTRRYEVGFWFEATTPRKTVMTTLLAAMDGWFGVRRDGAYVVRAGAFAAPVVIFGEGEIIDYSYNPGPGASDAINVYVLSFPDPANAYASTETDAWRNEDDIARRGEERSVDFSPRGVQGNSQLRRLAKAAMDRGFAGNGTFRTPLSARRGLGERYVGLRIEEEADLNDVVVEVLDVSIELETASIVWTYRLASAARYDWNALTEEGLGPVTAGRPAPEALTAPDITTLTAFYASLGTGGDGVRVRLAVTGPDRSDLSWFYRWRESGATSWVERSGYDIDPEAGGEFDTGEFVPADTTLQFQSAYQTGGGTLSPWSTTETIVTSTTAIAPGSPTDGGATSPASGQARLTWRNPTSVNFDHARIWRNTGSGSFATATVQDTQTGAAGASEVFNQTGLAAGSYRYWVTAENAADTASPPLGPLAVTVT